MTFHFISNYFWLILQIISQKSYHWLIFCNKARCNSPNCTLCHMFIKKRIPNFTPFFTYIYVGMPIPLQEMILEESGDKGMANCHFSGKGEFSAYSSGFGVGELGNENTKYRHSFQSLVNNQHYTLEILGFYYM